MFGILRRLLAGIWGILSLPLDFMGRSVEALGRAVEPVADRVARVAGRAARAVAEAVPYIGAGAVDAIRAPFEAFRPVTVQQVAPEERGGGWQPAVEASTWGFYVFLWATRIARGEKAPDMSEVPPGVRRWLDSLSPKEVVMLTKVMPDRIEAHVEGRKDGAIPGIRPYVTPARAKALEAARQRLAQVSLAKLPEEDLDLGALAYAPGAA